MEIAKEIIALLKDVAWPVVILIIALFFRKPLIAIVNSLNLDERKHHNLKFKIGSFEMESQLAAKAQERIQAIAEEPNLQKRLQMAKEPFLVEDALKAIDEKALETLSNLYKKRIDNAFYINWYNPIPGVDIETCRKLYELGLIKGGPMYDGDEVAWITPVGLALLERVNKIKGDRNESI